MTDPKEQLSRPDAGGLVGFVNGNTHYTRTGDPPVAWSTASSVLIDIALFLVLRNLHLGGGMIAPVEPEVGIMVLLPAGGEEMIIGQVDTGPTAVSGDSDPLGNLPAGTEGPVVTGDDFGDMVATSDALGDRLRRGQVLIPSMAVPTTRREPEVVVAGADGDPEPVEDDIRDVETDVTTIELADLPASDSLDLGRLTGLRPELAFMTASAWVLIRNQEEVEAYLRRTYRDGTLDRAAVGTVSVTLWIDQGGTVEWAEISQSSGRTDLDEVALALFNEVADFRAARDRGDSVSRSVTFSLNFPW